MNSSFYGKTIYQFDYFEALEMKLVTPFKLVPIWSDHGEPM